MEFLKCVGYNTNLVLRGVIAILPAKKGFAKIKKI